MHYPSLRPNVVHGREIGLHQSGEVCPSVIVRQDSISEPAVVMRVELPSRVSGERQS